MSKTLELQEQLLLCDPVSKKITSGECIQVTIKRNSKFFQSNPSKPNSWKINSINYDRVGLIYEDISEGSHITSSELKLNIHSDNIKDKGRLTISIQCVISDNSFWDGYSGVLKKSEYPKRLTASFFMFIEHELKDLQIKYPEKMPELKMELKYPKEMPEMKIRLVSKKNSGRDLALYGLIKWFAQKSSFDTYYKDHKTLKFKTFDDLKTKTESYLKNIVIPSNILDEIYGMIRKSLGDFPITDLQNLVVKNNEIVLKSFNYLDEMKKGISDLKESTFESLFLELIWTYWHEESMLYQCMKLITLRFQNVSVPGSRNQIMNFTTNPLRTMSSILWSYIDCEDRLLTVKRRAYEYEQEYGLKLIGKATSNLSAVDRRSKFLDSFHNLLNLCSKYFTDSNDKTIEPDPFPIKNSLRDLHLILAEGANNQYGDLPWTSRVETYTIKYLLSQPEMDDFLRGRPMVKYTEKWMDNVDIMKKLQGWDDTSVTHYCELAEKGEHILLSVRFGDWNNSTTTSDDAAVWAELWKEEIQTYIYEYRTVTGVDLTQKVDSRMPGILIQEKMRRKLSEDARA